MGSDSEGRSELSDTESVDRFQSRVPEFVDNVRKSGRAIIIFRHNTIGRIGSATMAHCGPDATLRIFQTPCLTILHASIFAFRPKKRLPWWESIPAGPAAAEIQAAAKSRAANRWERDAWAFESYSRQLIDIVAPLVPAIKPQVAFFEQLGVPGFRVLHSVMSYARRALIVIADATR